MNNILCKIKLHKWQKVKSTKINVVEIMISIIKERGDRYINDERHICKMFGVDNRNIWPGYDVYDYVCERCGKCKYNTEKKRNQLTDARNYVVEKKEKRKNRDKRAEKMYKGCKNGS